MTRLAHEKFERVQAPRAHKQSVDRSPHVWFADAELGLWEVDCTDVIAVDYGGPSEWGVKFQ
jgi:hypothetical protein